MISSTTAHLKYYTHESDGDRFSTWVNPVAVTSNISGMPPTLDDSTFFAVVVGVNLPWRTAIAMARDWADRMEFNLLPGPADHIEECGGVYGADEFWSSARSAA